MNLNTMHNMLFAHRFKYMTEIINQDNVTFLVCAGINLLPLFNITANCLGLRLVRGNNHFGDTTLVSEIL